MQPEPAYLDHAATTPISPRVLEAYTRQLAVTGNPSSLHATGRSARRVVEEARESIAADLGARPSEVIFTSGGTEGNNLAIKGTYWAQRKQDPQRQALAISAIEHHAVLDPAHWLAEHEGARVIHLPVDDCGLIRPGDYRDLLAEHAPNLALVSVMWANNEVGTVQPISELAMHAQAYNLPMHSDAVQALGQEEIDFDASGLSLLTITGHKIGAPGGIGALLAKRETKLEAVLHGGGQERQVRSGTLDAAAIHALAVAVHEVVEQREQHVAHLSALRDELIAGVTATIPQAQLRGCATASGKRLAANAHFTFPGCEGDSLLYLLDSAGVQCSTGSACQAGIPQPSHVLIAMGVNPADARGALRFSLGATSTRADVTRLLQALPDAVERASQAGLTSLAQGAQH